MILFTLFFCKGPQYIFLLSPELKREVEKQTVSKHPMGPTTSRRNCRKLEPVFIFIVFSVEAGEKKNEINILK